MLNNMKNKKLFALLLLGLLNCKVSVGGTELKIQQSSPSVFDKPYHVLCHRGVEYITRQFGESAWTLAVDKNNRPIQCKESQ